jgi:glucosyl-dolichyl phosphate glucuronosyltransferase
MELSVIIPTRNRARSLYAALESLTRQSISQDDFEIIIVDNGSTDETRIVATTFEGRLRNLVYCHEDTPGLYAGRHRGLRVAKSNLLVFTDDDIEAFPTWLDAIKESFEDDVVKLVGGKNLPKFEITPPQWIIDLWTKKRNGGNVLGYLSILDLGDNKKEIDPHLVFGCNFSIRKNVLLEAGGFHPDGFPQELIKLRGDGETYISKYIQNRGYKALYNPNASVYHLISQERVSLEYFLRRSFNQGISDSFTQIRNSYIEERNYFRPVSRSLYFLKRIKRMGREAYFRTTSDTLGRIKNRLESRYWDGFHYHQKEAMNDPELLQWITRENYLTI